MLSRLYIYAFYVLKGTFVHMLKTPIENFLQMQYIFTGRIDNSIGILNSLRFSYEATTQYNETSHSDIFHFISKSL